MKWLRWLFAVGNPVDSPALAAAIERAVEHVDPRLKQCPSYPGRFRKAVAHALEYAHRLAAQVPGPVAVNRDTFVSDPLVHALFASPDDIHAALCVSRAMHDYRQAHPDAGEVYALLCMRRGTKSTLGIELEGEVLRRDVPQQAVYFSGHTLADVGHTEAEARARIAEGFFASLVGHVRQRIEARKQEKTVLETRRDELLAALHSAPAERRRGLEAELQDLLKHLGSVTESLALRRYIEDFEAVLLAPERHVYLERTTLLLDSMGLLRTQDSEGHHKIEFCDLAGRDRRRWTVALMYCDRVHEEATLGDRLMVAQRWLGL